MLWYLFALPIATSAAEASNECPICFDAVNTADQLVNAAFPCHGPQFHIACIRYALMTGNQLCPLCRSEPTEGSLPALGVTPAPLVHQPPNGVAGTAFHGVNLADELDLEAY